ncbi:MAG: AAA family ATPase [Reyranellales bacterium]
MEPDFPQPHRLMPRVFSADKILAATLPPRELILDPVISTKSPAMLYGPRGLGKTHVALGIAWAAASGGSFLKWRAKRPHKVLYIDGEMPVADIQERLRVLGSAPTNLRFMMADVEPEGLHDLGKWDARELLRRTWGDTPDLLILDNLSSLVGKSTNAPDAWNGLQDWLLTRRREGMAVLVVHHANKDGEQRGTSRREDVLDIVLALRRPGDYQPKDGARFEVHFEKARGLFGDSADPFEARLETDGVGVARWQWQPLQVSQLDRAVALFNEGMGFIEAAKELGVSRATGYRLRKRAMELGLVG